MRNLMLNTMAICLMLMTSNVTFGQTGNQQQYPWSANPGQVPAYRSSTGTNKLPPIIKPGESVRSILQQDGQPVPQQQDYTLDPVAAPQTGVEGGQEPALSIQSNAITGQNYCNDCNSMGAPRSLFGNTGNYDIGGWVQSGYHSDSTGLWNNRPEDVGVSQFWLYAGRQATDQNRVGWRIDGAYGLDAQYFQAVGNPPTGNPSGWDNGWDHGSYGWALPQAYLEFKNGATTYRAGKFLSPFGCEKVPAIENFFYSRTYTRVMTEPFTHTGVIAERDLGCNRSFILGATAGWDTGFDGDSGFTVLTGFRFQLNPNVTIQTTSSTGDTGRRRGSGTLNSFVANVKLRPKVNYGLQADMVNLNVNSNDEFGIIQYLTYQRSERLALGTRLEWWKSDQIFADTKSTWSVTSGANYRATSNILIRPEVRMDWGAAAVDPGEAIFGIDAILIF